MNNNNPAREIQTYVCDYLNEQLSALSVDFLAEDRKDIEFQIKNNLQKVGLATTVMTPTMNYIGKTEHGQAWEVPDFTIQTVEYVPVNRASNKASWSSGFDVCFAAQQVMAGPDAKCGFGKFNPVRIEQGEDNGLLVNKAVFKCYFVDDQTPTEPPRP